MKHYNRVLFLGALISLIMAALVAVPLTFASTISDEQLLDQLARGALNSFATTRSAEPLVSDDIVTSDMVIMDGWAFGMVVVRPPADLHATPDLRLFIAQRQGDSWRLALEYTPEFYEGVAQSPHGLIPLGGRMALIEGSPQNQARNVTANTDSLLSLPFGVGETWVYVSGPHGNNGDAVRPWSSIDLHEQAKNGTGLVRSAREGTVWRSSSCPNFIRIDHAHGWQTGYYHLANERVNNGSYVERGQVIGNTSNNVGCGGWSSAPHVHFSLRRNGFFINIDGHNIGGWRIQEASFSYGGSAVRLRDNLVISRPAGLIDNYGAIGTSYADTRHDYNRDNRSDLWAVNMRDNAQGRTSLHIANAQNMGASLFSGATGLPPQPEWLNSAFASADFNRDGIPDLWVIHRWDGSEQTAFRIMNGADPRFLIADRLTALPMLSDDYVFAVADYNRDGTPDLWAINPRDSATNSVSVRVINGANPGVYLVSARGVNLPQQSIYHNVYFAVADYNLDGFPDLWAINAHDHSAGAVTVRIVSGKDWQTLLVDTVTEIPLQSTDISLYAFTVSDYNNDGIPDLWLIRRTDSQVRVYSGWDFTTRLISQKAWFPVTVGEEWQFLGADRSRAKYAPQTPNLRRPADALTLTDTLTTEFAWRPAGLAQVQNLVVKNALNVTVFKHKITDTSQMCDTECRVNPADHGVYLPGGETYRWFVKTKNAHGKSKSAMRTITVDIPGAPVGLYPLEGVTHSDESLFVMWEPRPFADRYKVVVKRVDKTYKFNIMLPADTACLQDEGVCLYVMPEPLTDGEYFWRVVARNDTNNGKGKSLKTFFTISVPVDGVLPEGYSPPSPEMFFRATPDRDASDLIPLPVAPPSQ